MYEGFFERHYPTKKELRSYSSLELKEFKDNIPDDLFEFLKHEGICSYSDNFLWTVKRNDYSDVLHKWGIDSEISFTFMRTAFGACLYFQNEEYFYLDPIEGRVVSLGKDTYLLLDLYLVMDAILTNGFFEDYYLNLNIDKSMLTYETVLAFVPPLKKGGSFEKSQIEIQDIFNHLIYLANLFGGKAKLVKV